MVSQWVNTDNLQNRAVNSLLARNDTVYAATSGAGFFYSLNSSLDWTQSNNGLGQNVSTTSVATSGNLIFLSTSTAGVFSSVAPGNNWISATSGISQTNVVALLSDSGNIYAGCIFAGVFRTTNNGVNWTRFALGEGDLLYSLHKNEQGFFIGLSGGGYRSTNNGANWSHISSGLLNSNVFSLCSKPGLLFAGTDLGFFSSTNIGSNWTQNNSGLEQVWLNEIAVVNGTLIAASRNNGIYVSFNNGNNWTAFNIGMNDTNITCLSYNNDFLFAGSSNGNIWRIAVQSIPVGITIEGTGEPDQFHLSQNYPNPFNPVTQIRYQLTVESNVTLRVYNLLGEEIATLADEKQQPGEHKLEFDGTNLPSGIYFYRLMTDSFSEVRSMVLSK